MDAEHDAYDPQAPAEVEASSSRPPLWRRFGVWVTVGVVLYVIAGAVLLVTVPDRLLAHWFPTLDESARAAFLGSAANVVLFGLGGTIALVGVGLSLSRHRQELEAADRDRQRLVDDRKREQARQVEVDAQRRIDTERALRERFVTTVKLLSDPAPVNRQAALFALGALADDWDAFGKPDEVQVCIEVLTGYLRAPRTDDMLVPLTQEQLDMLSTDERRTARRTTAQEISVKQAGCTVIRNHLAGGVKPHWRDRSIDLTGMQIDFPFHFGYATISDHGSIVLTGATIRGSGLVGLVGATIRGSGLVGLGGAKISDGGMVALGAATISDYASVVLTDATIVQRGMVSLAGVTMSDHTAVVLAGATVRDGGLVAFAGATISDHAEVIFAGTTISDHGTVDFTDATVRDGGLRALAGARISEGGLLGFEHS